MIPSLDPQVPENGTLRRVIAVVAVTLQVAILLSAVLTALP